MDTERFYDMAGSYTDHLWIEDKGDVLQVGLWVDDDYTTVTLDSDAVKKLRLALARWERSV